MNIKQQMAGLKSRMQALVDNAKAADRDLTDAEASEVERLVEQYKQLGEQLEKVEKSQRLLADLTAPVDDYGDGPDDARDPAPGWGGKSAAPGGLAKAFMSWRNNIGQKAIPPASAFTVPSVLPLLSEPGQARFLLDVVERGEMGPGGVRYVRGLRGTPNAQVVAEGTQKPTQALDASMEEVKATTVAVLSEKLPKQLFDDAGPGFTQWVENEFRYSIRLELEDQVLSGNGTDPNMRGILNTTGIQQQAFSTDVPATLRRALGLLEVQGWGATAIALNPEDAISLDLLRDTTERYLGSGPFTNGQRTLWGVPIVSTPTIPVGTAVVGDFRQVVLLQREAVNVLVFTSGTGLHDYNLVQVRAEGRFGLAIPQPSALVVADLTAA